MRLALEVRYLERCLERGGKYRFLRLETEKRQEPKLRNSRKGWNGEFTINLPDGKSHRFCAKEHPHIHGIVCVVVLGATRTLQVGVPNMSAKADAPVCALLNMVRVHASITTALSCMIAEDGTRGVKVRYREKCK